MRGLTVVSSLPNDASQGEKDTLEWFVGVIKGLEERNWMHCKAPGELIIARTAGRTMKVVYHSQITRGDIQQDIVKVMSRQVTYCHEQFGVRVRFLMGAP